VPELVVLGVTVALSARPAELVTFTVQTTPASVLTPLGVHERAVSVDDSATWTSTVVVPLDGALSLSPG
jgi:hypothetical protein